MKVEESEVTEEKNDTKTPSKRECTRCDGNQFLIDYAFGFGKYRCDTCGMVVGFDLDSDKAEFILCKGVPAHYTKEVFGNYLNSQERRL